MYSVCELLRNNTLNPAVLIFHRVAQTDSQSEGSLNRELTVALEARK